MPADLGAASWSEIDASNNAVPPNGWPEGMAPSDVNNAARSQMGGEKRWWDRSNATQTTTGTSTAYVLTYANTQTALYDGEETSFVLHVTNGTAPTLNRDGLGAKALRKFDFATNAFIAVASGNFKINQVLRVRYNLAADRYDVIGFAAGAGVFEVLATNNTWTGTNQFNATVTMSGAAFNEAARVTVASAATCDIGAAASNYVLISGTTTITGLGTVASGAYRHVRFGNVLTLTHNGTSLVLPNNGNNITTAIGDTAEFVSEGAGNWTCLNYQRANGRTLAASSVIQIVSVFDGTLATTAGNGIPVDNSKPQITEGDQIMSLAITPTSATSKLVIEVDAVIARANTDTVIMALFQDATANALAAVPNPVVGSIPTTMSLKWSMTSGTTIATTFKVRVGSATPSALFFNGDGTGQLLGGASASNITITEFVA